MDIPSLDISNPLVIRLVDAILRQLVPIFDSSQYFHIGGDEVNIDCWLESAQMVRYCYTYVYGDDVN